MTPVPEAAVEAAARAMYDANGALHRQLWIDRGRDIAEYDDPPRPAWEDATDYHRDLYRARVRAALPAIREGIAAEVLAETRTGVDGFTLQAVVNAAVAERLTAAHKVADELHSQGWSQGPKYAAKLRAALSTAKEATKHE